MPGASIYPITTQHSWTILNSQKGVMVRSGSYVNKQTNKESESSVESP